MKRKNDITEEVEIAYVILKEEREKRIINQKESV